MVRLVILVRKTPISMPKSLCVIELSIETHFVYYYLYQAMIDADVEY
jgi:hypothetical protein